jgi:ferredoxin-NADP reductase
MSGWLATAAPGTRVGIGVPAGDCFYIPPPGAPAVSLLLAGTGTGIAPLLAIARDALAHGHAGPVAVLHGAAGPDRLYLGTRAPRGVWPENLQWRTCALSAGQDIVAAVTAELAARDPAATRAFLCGGPGTVAAMRRALFLAGMSLRDICADAFAPAAPASGQVRDGQVSAGSGQ